MLSILSWTLWNGGCMFDWICVKGFLSPCNTRVDTNEPSRNVNPHISYDWGSDGQCQYSAQNYKHGNACFHRNQIIQTQYLASITCLVCSQCFLDKGVLSYSIWMENSSVPSIMWCCRLVCYGLHTPCSTNSPCRSSERFGILINTTWLFL